MPEILFFFLSFLKTWWWFFVPILLYFPCRFLYLWWINWEVWYKEIKWTILEIIPPSEIEKPFRAMEDVFASLWGVYDSPNWRERWCEGELVRTPFWFSFEIASFEGKIHFYLRIPKDAQKFAESIIHAHYPEAEIFEVEDYTQKVPQDLPNQNFDLYGEDYIFLRDFVYPIRTYKYFEVRTPEMVGGEKKIDPIYSLLEAMARLKKGEQFWFQIVCAPITDNDLPWVTRGREMADKIARRPSPPKKSSIVKGVFRVLLKGKIPFEEKKEEGIFIPELVLTPGEREILAAVEEKISKQGFKTFIRGVYIYKKDAFFPPHTRISRSYFLHFAAQNLNIIYFFNKTRTKVHYLFRQRRLYGRKKAMFEKYIKRLPPAYPNMFGEGNLILNSEELATIFHFPTKAAILPPGVPRVLAKKGEPPPGIPTG